MQLDIYFVTIIALIVNSINNATYCVSPGQNVLPWECIAKMLRTLSWLVFPELWCRCPAKEGKMFIFMRAIFVVNKRLNLLTVNVLGLSFGISGNKLNQKTIIAQHVLSLSTPRVYLYNSREVLNYKLMD